MLVSGAAWANCAPGVTVNCGDTVTTNTTSPANPGFDRAYPNVSGVQVDSGKTVSGNGLAISNSDAITVVNDGTIGVDPGKTPSAGGTAALTIRAAGGGITYTGSGAITNNGSGNALVAALTGGAGSIDLTIGGNIVAAAGDGVNVRDVPTSTGLTVTTNGTVTASASRSAISVVAQSLTGNIIVTTNGAISAGVLGIYAETAGAGDVTVSSQGPVAATTSDGVLALSQGGNVTVTTRGAVSGTLGIKAESEGAGDVTVSSQGPVAATTRQGISAQSQGGNVIVSANDVSAGAEDAIIAYQRLAGGAGSVSVTTDGAVSGKHGIYAESEGAGDVSVTSRGPVTGTTNAGIFAQSQGGNVTVSAGDASSSAGIGLIAQQVLDGGAGRISVATSGKISGTYGLYALSLGAGDVGVTSRGPVTGTTNFGLYAGGAGGNVTISAGDVTSGADFAIAAQQYLAGGAGNISITTSGNVSGTSGIAAETSGSGNVTVAIGGNVAATSGAGVYAANIGSTANAGAIDVTLATGKTVTAGGNGIYTDSGISIGGTTVTVAGAIKTSAAGKAGVHSTATTGPIGVIVTATGTVDSDIGIDLSSSGALNVNNAGTIRAGTGKAIQFAGNSADTITNSGTITGGSAGAIDMGDGNDTLNLLTGSVITGTVDGGAGSDAIMLAGTGNGSFAGAVNFETLSILSGNWTLSAGSTFANGMAIAANSTLTGNAGTLGGSITNSGTVTFSQTSDGAFTGSLAGTGQLVKSGAGALTIGSQLGFTGPTSVTAGRLILAGTLPSAVTVGSGATLAGVGTVASLAIGSGGTVAPGNSPGTITVTGNFMQAAGSTYLAETTSAGASDRIVVGGTATIGAGAQLSVTRDTGTYTVGTRYTLLTANGGISGTYTLAQTASAGTEFRLGQTGTALYVDVARSGAALLGLAATPNQAAVASALGALGVANPAYSALTAIPDNATARAGLDALSGEFHASVRTAAVIEAGAAQNAVGSRISSPGTGTGLWMQAVRRDGSDDGLDGTASAERDGWGGFGGLDFAVGDTFRVGVAGGYVDTKLKASARSSAATLKTTHALVYAGGTFGRLSVRGAMGYAWVRNGVMRSVSFTGFQDTLAARYDGNVLHGFGEIGAVLPLLAGTVEPFAGIAVYRVHTDAFTERGGAAALAGNARDQTFTQSRLGLRVATPIAADLSARASAAWQHMFDDERPLASLRFAGGALPFLVAGTALSRDAAALALDLDWMPKGGNVTVTVGYAGMIGAHNDDSNLHLGVAVKF